MAALALTARASSPIYFQRLPTSCFYPLLPTGVYAVLSWCTARPASSVAALATASAADRGFRPLSGLALRAAARAAPSRAANSTSTRGLPLWPPSPSARLVRFLRATSRGTCTLCLTGLGRNPGPSQDRCAGHESARSPRHFFLVRTGTGRIPWTAQSGM